MPTQSQITAFETKGHRAVENLRDQAPFAAMKSKYSGLWKGHMPVGARLAIALPTPIHRWQADSPACA